LFWLVFISILMEVQNQVPIADEDLRFRFSTPKWQSLLYPRVVIPITLFDQHIHADSLQTTLLIDAIPIRPTQP